MSRGIARLWLFLLIGFLGAFVVWAGLNAWADQHYLKAREVSRRAVVAGSVDAEQLRTGVLVIEQALRFFPTHSEYLDIKGLLLEYSADMPGVAGAERRHLLTQAAGQYRLALTHRPLWPYSWVNLLSAKDKLGQIDDEFLRAFERSDTLGPWEPPIQLQLIYSALANWPDLGVSQHQRTGEIIERAMQRQGGQVLALVRSMNRMDLLCPLQASYPQIQPYCGV